MFRFPVLIVVTLSWGALAFGAVYDWAYTPLLVVCSAVGLAGLLARRTRVQASVGWPVIAGLLTTALVVALQLLPLSPTILQRISPATDTLLRGYSFAYAMGVADAARVAHPVSIAPHLTLVSLAFLLSLSLLLVGSVRILSRQDLLVIAHGVIVISVVLALAGMMQRATYNGMIYGFWQPRYVSSPFGPFVNYNHFAGWMLMALPLAIGCLCARLQRTTRTLGPTWRDRIVWLASPKASQATLIAAASLIMTVALFLTTSRSGITGFALAASILGWVMLRKHAVASHRIAATTYLLLLAVLGIGWTGASGVFDRFSALPGSNLGNRFGVWQDALGVIGDFPLTGTGLNTFGVAMLFYQRHEVTSRILQAHNDYLQLVSDGGLVLAVPVVVTAALLGRAVWRRFREPHPHPTMYWLRVGAVTGLAAIGLQESVDFSLQIPGNAVLFTVLCVIALGGGHEDRTVKEARGSRHRAA